MRNIFRLEIDPGRTYGLDILRALAILFVVVAHGDFILPEKMRRVSDLFIYDGVSIFFVLSGFLIGGILIKILEKNSVDFKLLFDFWIRRWFRTLPNYFLILLILVFLNLLFTEDFTVRSVNRYFIFSQNFFLHHPAFFPEAWSLSVEEWFYLLAPLTIFVLIIFFKVSPRIATLFTALLIIFLVTGFRLYRFEIVDIEHIGHWDLLFRKQVLTRLDGLMYGVLGAYMYFYHPKRWLKHKRLLLVIGIILFPAAKYIIPLYAGADSLYYAVFSFSLISFATLLLLPYLNDFKKGQGFLYKPLTYISLISYSMYLLNLSIIQHWIIDRLDWGAFSTDEKYVIFAKYSLFWFLVITLSILLYKNFEIPMTRLRESDRFKIFLNK